jgi:2-oxoglutarate dehydrogenase E1 component
MGAFGPNEWLVDELYDQWLNDKDSVDRAWWEFFEDYRPGHPSTWTPRSRYRRPPRRAVPAKLLIDNRAVDQQAPAPLRGGKVSFTHLIGYAIVQALKVLPAMNAAYKLDVDGKPVVDPPRTRQPRARHRPGEAGRHPQPARAVNIKAAEEDGLLPLLEPLRGASCARSAPASSPSTTSRAPRSR